MIAVTITYLCGCQAIRFVQPLTAHERCAFGRLNLCPLCEASRLYRTAMAHQEAAERATRAWLAVQT